MHGRKYNVISSKAKEEIRKENSQENSQANQLQTREYTKVEELEIDSHKPSVLYSRESLLLPKVVMPQFGCCLSNQIYILQIYIVGLNHKVSLLAKTVG